jgi:hypothetical protein
MLLSVLFTLKSFGSNGRSLALVRRPGLSNEPTWRGSELPEFRNARLV